MSGNGTGRRGDEVGSRRPARLVAVAVLAFLLFNVPFLAVADQPVRVLGVPLLWGYLFLVWAGVIALVAWAMRDPAP